jgi:outer membrane protein OmpA-like peptidoglycan-associated protein
LCIKAIYFDFDGFNIRKNAETDRELNKVLTAMKLYPDLKIRIESHTDSRGSFAYNVNLAQKRAESTLNRLKELGADRNRLVAVGFGERQLLDRCIVLDECGKEVQIPGCSMDQYTKKTSKCSDGVKCTEDEHQQNRRSKFIAID